MVSLPSPPLKVSAAALPVMLSAPPRPSTERLALMVPAAMMSLPSVPRMLTVPSPETVTPAWPASIDRVLAEAIEPLKVKPAVSMPRKLVLSARSLEPAEIATVPLPLSERPLACPEVRVRTAGSFTVPAMLSVVAMPVKSALAPTLPEIVVAPAPEMFRLLALAAVMVKVASVLTEKLPVDETTSALISETFVLLAITPPSSDTVPAPPTVWLWDCAGVTVRVAPSPTEESASTRVLVVTELTRLWLLANAPLTVVVPAPLKVVPAICSGRRVKLPPAPTEKAEGIESDAVMLDTSTAAL